MKMIPHLRLVLLAAITSLVLITSAWAQQNTETYRIGPEDVLSITFWQQPDLNQLVKVRSDGIVALPVIGETRVADLTPEEAADRIVTRISRYNRDISQALVQVQEFNSRKVFVTGNVGTPGRYTYEFIPDLWTIIRDAGGPTEVGDLSQVTVVSPSGSTQKVNLSQILASGQADTLPDLQAGTTVEVPLERVASDTYRLDENEDRDPIVFVTGGVLTPGPVPIEGQMSIFDAVAKAGGFSPTGDPKKVRIVSKGVDGPVTYNVDLRTDKMSPMLMDYQMHYEDVILVGEKGPSTASIIGTVGVALAGVASLIIVLDYIDRTF
jgi:polysaccharide export outer membrane protein